MDGGPLQVIDDPNLGEFFDILASGGQPLNLADDGEVEFGMFDGNHVFRSGLLVVAQNGGVAFGQKTISDLEPVNEPIPSGSAFIGSQAALVFWDDIDDKEGDVSFLEIANDPVMGDRLILQWDYHNFDGTGTTLMFQVHVLANFEPTGIYAQFMYEVEKPSTGAGASATIGYQDGGAGFGDLQFSFNAPDAVTNGTVLSLVIPEPGDLDANGRIDVNDLLLLLAAWGRCADCGTCPADLDGDCGIGVDDLLDLLANWS